jgi:hypothetical protein
MSVMGDGHRGLPLVPRVRPGGLDVRSLPHGGLDVTVSLAPCGARAAEEFPTFGVSGA